MIVVHHLNNSRSQRVLWLLEELGLAYETSMAKGASSRPLARASGCATPIGCITPRAR